MDVVGVGHHESGREVGDLDDEAHVVLRGEVAGARVGSRLTALEPSAQDRVEPEALQVREGGVIVDDVEADVVEVVGVPALDERARVRAAIVERLDDLDPRRRPEVAQATRMPNSVGAP